MKLKPGYLTNDAIVLAEKAVNGTVRLTPTRAVLSSDDYSNSSDDTIMALKSLNAFAEIKIDYGSTVDPSKINFPMKFDNTKMTQDNYVKTVGIYFSDGTNEYLYSVLVNTDPELFPAYNGSVAQTLKFNWGVFVGRASQVNLTLSDMDNVTTEQLTQAVTSANSNAQSLADSAYAHASFDLSSYASNNDLKQSVASNTANITSLASVKADKSDLDATFQNAVNASKSYADSNANKVIPFTNYSDALSAAKSSTERGIFIYPTTDYQPGKIFTANVIYSYGSGLLPDIRLSLINSDTSKFTFNNAYATFNQNTMVITLHGSIITKSSVDVNGPVAALDINSLGMNVITSSFLNSQTISVDTKWDLSQMIISNNLADGAGAVYNLDGCTINLAYDANAKPKTHLANIKALTNFSIYSAYGTKPNVYLTANGSRLIISGTIAASSSPYNFIYMDAYDAKRVSYTQNLPNNVNVNISGGTITIVYNGPTYTDINFNNTVIEFAAE